MEEQKSNRGRKPKGWRARSAAERQAERRARLKTAAAELAEEKWTEAVCLDILTGKKWRGGPMDKAAWEQLGRLRGFVL